MADLSDSSFSEIDANNNASPPNGWPEGMMPSGVNDAARNDRAALKRFWNKINPVQTITPAGGIWQFTTGNPAYPAAYLDGEIYRFTPGGPSAGGDQFQVNSLGLKPIWKHNIAGPSGWSPIVTQDIIGTVGVELIYSAALNGGAGAFVLLNPHLPLQGDGTGTGVLLYTPSAQPNLTIQADGGFYAGIRYQGLGSPNQHLWGVGLDNVTPDFTIDDGTLGAIRFRVAASSGNITVANNLTVGGTLGVAGNVGFNASLNVLGITAQSGGITSTGDCTFYANLTVDQTANVGTNLAVAGQAYLNGGATIGAGGIVVSNGNLTVSVGNAYKPGGGLWSATSDRRVKRDVAPYTTALDAITKLTPISYKYNGLAGTPDDDKTYVGLVADDVKSIMPEMIEDIQTKLNPTDEQETTVLTTNVSALTYALLNSCKELAARVAALEAQLALQG